MSALKKLPKSPKQRDLLGDVYRNLSRISTSLIDLRGHYDGDMDSFLIHLIVLLDDLASASNRLPRAQVGVSAASIGEITGIPRETVRRKIAGLVDNGMLRRERLSRYHVADVEALSLIAGGPLGALGPIANAK
ncbi:hypothetical protein BH09PSE3_BH09PSE3_22500 [soil metagenome]